MEFHRSALDSGFVIRHLPAHSNTGKTEEQRCTVRRGRAASREYCTVHGACHREKSKAYPPLRESLVPVPTVYSMRTDPDPDPNDPVPLPHASWSSTVPYRVVSSNLYCTVPPYLAVLP
jgi:hypothetical protein